MATVTIELRRDKTRGRGEVQLYLLIRHRKQRSRIALPLYVKPKDWNADRLQVRKTAADFAAKNAYLAERIAKARRIVDRELRKDRRLVTRRIKDELEADDLPDEEDFVEYANRMIDAYRRRGQIGTAKSYQKALNKFVEFLDRDRGRKRIYFDELSPALVRDFITYCRDVRGNSVNTASKAAQILRTLVGYALSDDLLDYSENPFRKVSLSWEEPSKDALTYAEILEIENADGLSATEARIRDWFLFAFYAWGRRFSDVAKARFSEVESRSDGWWVRYRTKKTKRTIWLPLPEQARAIIERHYDERRGANGLVFDILSEEDFDDELSLHNAISAGNALANKYLKRVAKKAGVDVNLTTKVARHSIGDYLLERGYTMREIQKIFAHATQKQTETYVRALGRTGVEGKLRAEFG